MGKPELGQRVQLLQGVSRWLFAFLDKPRERGGTHRSGTHCVSTHSVLMFGLVCACEKKKKTEITYAFASQCRVLNLNWNCICVFACLLYHRYLSITVIFPAITIIVIIVYPVNLNNQENIALIFH